MLFISSFTLTESDSSSSSMAYDSMTLSTDNSLSVSYSASLDDDLNRLDPTTESDFLLTNTFDLDNIDQVLEDPF